MAYNDVFTSLPMGSPPIIGSQGMGGGIEDPDFVRDFFWFEGLVNDFTFESPITTSGVFAIKFDMCLTTIAPSHQTIILGTDDASAYIYQNGPDLIVQWNGSNLISLDDFIQPNELTTITVSRSIAGVTKIHSTSQGGREFSGNAGTNSINFTKLGRFTSDILRYEGVIANLTFDIGHNGTVDHSYAMNEGSGSVFSDSVGGNDGLGSGTPLSHNWGTFDKVGTQWIGRSLDTPRSWPSADYTMEIVD